jgi:hypothetical protein
VTGGCLCGALRYEAMGTPLAMGFCYCADCRKASGAGFIPFATFSSQDLHITGPVIAYTSKAARGGDTVRNSCAVCASLVFGGPLGKTDQHTIYAGSADDPSWFKPTMAIFARNAPDWTVIPPELRRYDGLPVTSDPTPSA